MVGNGIVRDWSSWLLVPMPGMAKLPRAGWAQTAKLQKEEQRQNIMASKTKESTNISSHLPPKKRTIPITSSYSR